MKVIDPHLEVEARLFADGVTFVGAMDEVGRGSAFGPCSVGLVLLDAHAGAFPVGLRDSKLLSESAREQLVAPLFTWVSDFAVGHASAAEIDEFGLTAALRLAGHRALHEVSLRPDVLLLDGRHDWLSPPSQGSLSGPVYPIVVVPPVRTIVKGDLTCASVAAASVLAKVARDHLVRDLARQFPGYDVENNKGYVTATHAAALRRLGPSLHHRVSWNLPAHDMTATTTLGLA